MKKLKRTAGLLMILFIPVTLALQTSGEEELVSRGEYLVERVTLCTDCHTPLTEQGEPDRERWLQGTALPYGPFDESVNWASYAPPIAGLPRWEKEDAIKYMETGLKPDGRRSRMPMPQYRLKREDAEAVVAYLMSLKKDQ